MDFESSLENLIQKWQRIASLRDPYVVRIPLGAYLDEANELAALMERHVDPVVEGDREYPGLGRVFDETHLTWDTPGEIRELVFVIRDLHARARSQPMSPPSDSVTEARKQRGEWMAALGYLFEQRKDAEGLSSLSRVRRGFKDQSREALAQSLLDLTTCAERNIEELQRFGYGHEHLTRSRELHAELLERGARLKTLRENRKRAVLMRNQLLGLLDEKVQASRRAFRFVFRNHEEVLELAQSRYARTRRRKYSTSKKGGAPSPLDGN